MVTYDDLLAHAPKDAPYRPLLEALFVGKRWITEPMLKSLDPSEITTYLNEVAQIWSAASGMKGLPADQAVAQLVGGLLFDSDTFLRLQIEFAKTGELKSKDFDAVNAAVYSSPEKMAQYLDGLLVTYIGWPNHYRLWRYYVERYLPRGTYGACLEIGPGHGWLARGQLMANPKNRLTGLDISPSSVAYTSGILKASGIAADRFSLSIADCRKGLPHGSPTYDRVVIAEVIEHLDDPDTLLRSAVAHAHAETMFFITTTVNIEAIDHIYLFRDLEEVRAMMRRCGLEIVDELDLPLSMKLKMERPMFEVAVICKKA
ncbi:MAG: class I SAM-dependent methyltransferase [Phycisphaerales bacterium]